MKHAFDIIYLVYERQMENKMEDACVCVCDFRFDGCVSVSVVE